MAEFCGRRQGARAVRGTAGLHRRQRGGRARAFGVPQRDLAAGRRGAAETLRALRDRGIRGRRRHRDARLCRALLGAELGQANAGLLHQIAQLWIPILAVACFVAGMVLPVIGGLDSLSGQPDRPGQAVPKRREGQGRAGDSLMSSVRVSCEQRRNQINSGFALRLISARNAGASSFTFFRSSRCHRR